MIRVADDKNRLDPPPAHPDAAHPWDEEYLGPELPKDKWWKEVDLPELVESEKPKITLTSPLARSMVKEPLPAFELKRPPSQQAQPKTKSPARPALVTDFTSPQGSFSQRLNRVNAIGRPRNQMELAELVAALGDENGQIRYFAGASLTRLGGLATVNMLSAYLQTNPGAAARGEALEVLGM